MPIDPRTPVLVGAGQTQQRVEDPAQALEPIDLLAVAARAADADTRARPGRCSRRSTRSRSSTCCRGSTRTRARCSVAGSVRHPAPRSARRSAATPPRCWSTGSPRRSVAAITTSCCWVAPSACTPGGGPVARSRRRGCTGPSRTIRRATEVWGDDRPGSSQYEMAHLAVAPTQVYPLFETALRAAAGRGIDEHQRLVSELWSGFAAVAAENPNAWSRTPYTAEEIRTVGDGNRMVTFPYPKRLCANIDVDQAAAVLLCSYEAARAAGVPEDRLVFPLAGADAHDHYFFTERDSLAESPAIRVAGAAALDAAGLGIDDVARFDLYSCFPAAVEIAMKAFGLRGPAGRGRPAADPHRRTRLRGWAGQQLLDARDRDGRRRVPRRPGFREPRHRARLVRDEALGRPVLHDSARRPRLRRGRPGRDAGARSMRSRVASPRARSTARSSSKRPRSSSSATAPRASGSSRAR